MCQRLNAHKNDHLCPENRHYSASRKITDGQVLPSRRPWVNLKPPKKEKGGRRSPRLILRRILRTSPPLLQCILCAAYILIFLRVLYWLVCHG